MYFIVQKSAFSTTYTISFKHDISLGLTLQNLKTICTNAEGLNCSVKRVVLKVISVCFTLPMDGTDESL